MTVWHGMETAPKDRKILLFGKIDPKTNFELLRWTSNSVFTGTWDDIDEYFVPCGGTWEGPFMECVAWAECPKGPE